MSAASFVIQSVLVILLLVLQSPNKCFGNFTVSIAKRVTAKEQLSTIRL